MLRTQFITAIVAGLVLAGCSDRTANKTARGAALGALATVVVGGSVVKGALVGGAVGALTSKDQHTWE